ncbi:hypothetical protein FACS189499_07650 [Clostridia bacterium]|nr:hypothetical protein FACS189499_07650 [Clostridia bacterium]
MDSQFLANYTPKQLTEAVEEIYFRYTKGMTAVSFPHAMILGGQPGSGKTTIQNAALAENPNMIVINADEFRRYHPNFAALNETFGVDSVLHTGAFSGAVAEKLIEKLSDEKYNLIIEGTLRTAETPLKTNELLKNKGYTTELSVMAVDRHVSWQGTLDRFEAMKATGDIPRATPKEHHDLVADILPKNLGAIFEANKFDKITLYNRSGECLYNSENTPALNPAEALHNTINSLSIYYEQKGEAAFLLRMYEHGVDPEDIAKLTGTDSEKVKTLCVTKDISSYAENPHDISNSTLEKAKQDGLTKGAGNMVAALSAKGKSPEDIAKLTGYKSETIAKLASERIAEIAEKKKDFGSPKPITPTKSSKLKR